MAVDWRSSRASVCGWRSCLAVRFIADGYAGCLIFAERDSSDLDWAGGHHEERNSAAGEAFCRQLQLRWRHLLQVVRLAADAADAAGGRDVRRGLDNVDIDL